MPRLLLCCLVLLLITDLPASAQKNLILRGTVLQPDKKTPIPGASVTLLHPHKVILSDEAGQFQLQAQDTLLVRAMGYKPLLYLPKKAAASELRVVLVLQEDSVLLNEVQIWSLPSEEMIQRALRNMATEKKALVKRPGYIPGLEPPPPPPAPLPNVVLNPFSAFSKEGKEKRKLDKLLKADKQKQQKQEQEWLKQIQEQAKQDYNRFFKNNTGYE